jgi:hypothetical protein
MAIASAAVQEDERLGQLNILFLSKQETDDINDRKRSREAAMQLRTGRRLGSSYQAVKA